MEKTYNIRISFNHGNDITLDLKGCGLLHIKPGKDYYFTNAPIEFTNYLAQLRRLGITYKMTPDRKGCYQTADLTMYNKNDAREILKNLRKANIINEDAYLNEETKKTKKINNYEEKKVVLSSDDLIKTEEVVVESLNNVTPEETKEEIVDNTITEVNVDDTIEAVETASEEIVEEAKETTDIVEEVKEEPKVYSEEELNKMSKNDLLNIANSYGIKEVSEINTKKEIREAILKAQK